MPDSGYQQGAAIVITLKGIDWLFVITFFVVSLIVGIAVSRRAGRSSSEFFLSGRAMPWWLLGVSMVATTFSTDTPNLVTDIVRQNGVSGNWVWWAFLLTGMLTVFVYARLWRRSGRAPWGTTIIFLGVGQPRPAKFQSRRHFW